MSKNTEKPAGLPTGNTVDATLLEEDIDSAYISFQATNIKLENPPQRGDSGMLIVHWKCKKDATEEQEDGEIRKKRVLKVTDVHWPGKRPTSDPDQEPLFSAVTDASGTRFEGAEEGGDGDED